jgi:SWI/SNF-related matrix-associated actin-dependent regulator of chromatin subfamily A-like protein 1
MTSRLFLDNDSLALDFPYEPSQVAEVKRIPDCKWDKVARLWRCPVSRVHEVREFASRHGFDIDNEVLRFTLPTRRSAQDTGVYEKGDDIYISFPYDPVMVRSVKQIPSVTWDKKTGAWRAPLTAINEAIQWAERFDKPVAPEVVVRAKEINSQLLELAEASRAVESDIKIGDTGLERALLPYQKAGVAYAKRAKRCFIADEMGLGKTLQAIATIEVLSEYPAVVMCPPNLVLNWKAEYAKWLPHRKVATVLAGKGQKEFPQRGTYDVLVVGYSNISYWESHLIGHCAYVLDESHYCKTITAKRTKSARKIVASLPSGAPVLCLTGTPVTNRPAEYVAQLDILGKIKDFGGTWGFYRRYCAAFQDKWGQWHLEGSSNLEELNQKLRSVCYIRRTKDQVLTELPPVFHQELTLIGAGPAMADYDKAQKDIVAFLVERAKQLAIELGTSPHSAAVRARMRAESAQDLIRLSVLRRLAAKAKMESVIEWVQQRTEGGAKVVIAAHHRDVVDELANRFGGLKIQGGMSVEEVEEVKHKFQTDPKCQVITLSIQAAKTGHTLTAAQDIIFVELPWTPADIDQTYSRLHRMGQKGSVTATYALCAGTIDEEIYSIIAAKRSVVTTAIDGGPAIDDASVGVQLVMSLIGSLESP